MSIPAEYAEGIRGVVWDAEADAPAAGAVVSLESAGRPLARTFSDQNGVFSFDSTGALDIAPGGYRLVFEVHGRQVERALTVQASEPVTLVGRIDV